MINPPAVYIYICNSHAASTLMLTVWLTVALIQISLDVPLRHEHQKNRCSGILERLPNNLPLKKDHREELLSLRRRRRRVYLLAGAIA